MIRLSRPGLLLGILATSFFTPARAQPPDPDAFPSGSPSAGAPSRLLEILWPTLSPQLGGPSQLTLQGEAMPLPQVVELLNRQSALPFSVAPGASAKAVTGRFDSVPFWSVVRQIERQAGVVSVVNPARPGVQWEVGDPTVWWPLGTCGPLDVSARIGPDDPNAAARLELRLRLDPRVHLIDNLITYDLTEATDAAGHSLLPPLAEGTLAPDSYRFNPYLRTLTLDLKRAAGGGKLIKTLRGEWRMVVATRQEVWEIPDPLRAAPQERTVVRGGNQDRLVFEGMRRQGADFVAKVRVSRTLGVPFYLRANGPRFYVNPDNVGPVRLLDSMGRDFGYPQFATGSAPGFGAETTALTCLFQPPTPTDRPPGDPTTLAFTLPTRWAELVVPFEFHDVPLP